MIYKNMSDNKFENFNQVSVQLLENYTDQEKDEIWNSWMQDANYAPDVKHHLGEFKSVNRQHLENIDWFVMDNWENMTEKELNDIEKNERIENEENFNLSRENIYAAARGKIIDKQIRERFDK